MQNYWEVNKIDPYSAFLILAVYTTLVIVTGIYSSWEFGAILAILITLFPLFLFPQEYLNFLKVVLIDAEIYRITVFSYLLIFDAIIVGYAFNAWVKTLFAVLLILLVSSKIGLLGNMVESLKSAASIIYQIPKRI